MGQELTEADKCRVKICCLESNVWLDEVTGQESEETDINRLLIELERGSLQLLQVKSEQ